MAYRKSVTHQANEMNAHSPTTFSAPARDEITRNYVFKYKPIHWLLTAFHKYNAWLQLDKNQTKFCILKKTSLKRHLFELFSSLWNCTHILTSKSERILMNIFFCGKIKWFYCRYLEICEHIFMCLMPIDWKYCR